MTSNEIDTDQEFANYEQAQHETDERIDSLRAQYNIPDISDDADPRVLISDQILRLQVQRLVTSQKEGANDETLLMLKRTIIIDALARERFAADSGWIDLINDIVPTETTVKIDEVVGSEIAFAKEEKARSTEAFQRLATFLGKLGLFDGKDPLTIEDARAFRENLTADQREQLEALEAQQL